ncbi:hypothetical protein NEOKW01_0630 [Nematocida sp. AWRm80]|nr:hypothetical protein NEOKW01_0630 [Nematocida sp. AWRm80]
MHTITRRISTFIIAMIYLSIVAGSTFEHKSSYRRSRSKLPRNYSTENIASTRRNINSYSYDRPTSAIDLFEDTASDDGSLAYNDHGAHSLYFHKRHTNSNQLNTESSSSEEIQLEGSYNKNNIEQGQEIDDQMIIKIDRKVTDRDTNKTTYINRYNAKEIEKSKDIYKETQLKNTLEMVEQALSPNNSPNTWQPLYPEATSHLSLYEYMQSQITNTSYICNQEILNLFHNNKQMEQKKHAGTINTVVQDIITQIKTIKEEEVLTNLEDVDFDYIQENINHTKNLLSISNLNTIIETYQVDTIEEAYSVLLSIVEINNSISTPELFTLCDKIYLFIFRNYLKKLYFYLQEEYYQLSNLMDAIIPIDSKYEVNAIKEIDWKDLLNDVKNKYKKSLKNIEKKCKKFLDSKIKSMAILYKLVDKDGKTIKASRFVSETRDESSMSQEEEIVSIFKIKHKEDIKEIIKAVEDCIAVKSNVVLALKDLNESLKNSSVLNIQSWHSSLKVEFKDENPDDWVLERPLDVFLRIPQVATQVLEYINRIQYFYICSHGNTEINQKNTELVDLEEEGKQVSKVKHKSFKKNKIKANNQKSWFGNIISSIESSVVKRIPILERLSGSNIITAGDKMLIGDKKTLKKIYNSLKNLEEFTVYWNMTNKSCIYLERLLQFNREEITKTEKKYPLTTLMSMLVLMNNELYAQNKFLTIKENLDSTVESQEKVNDLSNTLRQNTNPDFAVKTLGIQLGNMIYQIKKSLDEITVYYNEIIKTREKPSIGQMVNKKIKSITNPIFKSPIKSLAVITKEIAEEDHLYDPKYISTFIEGSLHMLLEVILKYINTASKDIDIEEIENNIQSIYFKVLPLYTNLVTRTKQFMKGSTKETKSFYESLIISEILRLPFRNDIREINLLERILKKLVTKELTLYDYTKKIFAWYPRETYSQKNEQVKEYLSMLPSNRGSTNSLNLDPRRSYSSKETLSALKNNYLNRSTTSINELIKENNRSERESNRQESPVLI